MEYIVCLLFGFFLGFMIMAIIKGGDKDDDK